MNVYEATFRQAVNEDFELILPVGLEDFQVVAESIEGAAERIATKLAPYMCGNEYHLDDVSDGSCEFWFGDEQTNQNVRFTIEEI